MASVSASVTPPEHREPINPLRWLLFGRPVSSEMHEHALLPKILALPVYASDAISSSVYATQEILLALSVAGMAALGHTVHLSIAIGILLAIVVLSYRQTMYAYPSGGGSYIVAKDNLGVRWGLVAAAALLIDYILTVAVSIASGVQNLLAMPFMQGYKEHAVAICVGMVIMLTLANLRGLKESGTMFAIPTYCFVVSCFSMIGLGIFGPALLGWKLNPTPPAPSPIEPTQTLGLTLLLNAFSRGCAALTGTEAISNGVPSFREPKSKNAATTLTWMAIILGSLFLGISVLGTRVGLAYVDGSEPVIDQLNEVVFGKGSVAYYFLQVSTVAILVLAANTSFADFPRLSAILGRDSYMPRQLANIGDRLTFSNGIVLLGLLSCVLLAVFEGSTDRLIPLYAIGVFLAFTLSQSGMVVSWWRERGAGWVTRALVNGVGALATFIVLCTIAFEKIVLDIVHHGGREFGWIIAVLIGILYFFFRAVERHYQALSDRLSLDGYRPKPTTTAHTVLLLVPRMHRGVLAALDYCRNLGKDVRGLHISIERDTSLLERLWEVHAAELPLVIIDSPYRSIIGPLVEYLDEVEKERPGAYVTVVVPEAVAGRWWHGFLHAHYGAWIKLYLMNRRNVVVTNMRYFTR